MSERNIILNRLLDKYENSKHLSEPGTSLRRVMLRVVKKEFPEYDYEDAATRDVYNAAALELESQQLVHLEWIKDRPLLSAVVLNLNQVMRCYDLAGRVHPKVRATHVASLVSDSLEGVVVPWITAWRDEICTEAQEHMKVPSFCKDDDYLLNALLYSFPGSAALSGSITMRAFSSKCFHDTKYFERNVRETFLRIARKYDTGLAQSCEESELGEREQLAFLGIYARPELYELAGNCTIQTHQGNIYIGAATPHGLALPSTLVDTIAGIDLRSIQCVTFIENKTNYDEYLISERQPEELVIFHGGFLSPQKRKLFALIGDAASASIKVQFWADIDMGGFRMFEHLQRLIPHLQPMRMSGNFVEKYHQNGLVRPEKYLFKLKTDMQDGEYPLFVDAINEILKYGVTIEQEIFLN